MRVIAGALGGRTFNAPHGHRTHPMSDKIRGALFNALGDIEGLTVLDAFAGSGAISFEAVSRGAVSSVAIENDRLAQRTISENITSLGVQKAVTLIQASAQAWRETNPTRTFDIVVLDPPYDNVQLTAVQRLFSCAANNGIVVLSWPGDQLLPEVKEFQIVAQKAYGDAQLGFYKRS